VGVRRTTLVGVGRGGLVRWLPGVLLRRATCWRGFVGGLLGTYMCRDGLVGNL